MFAKRLLGKKEKSPSRLRYALLEIAIIIIGILLSVAITEWFGNRKDNKRETNYLENIVKDLTLDLENLNADIAHRSNQLEACQALINTEGLGGEISMDLATSVAKSFKELAKTISFSPSKATFHALESTGRMELIDNDEIVRRLIELHTGYYDLIEQNNNDVTRYRDNFLLPFMVKNLNFGMAYSSNEVKRPLLHDDPEVLVEMTNHVIYNQISLGSTVATYYQTISYVEETLALVKKELE